MALAAKLHQRQILVSAPRARPVGRLGLCKARVVKESQTQTYEPSLSYSDSSEDERPSTSGSGVDAATILFDEHHIPAWRPDLALYAPIGLALAAFRSALWLLGIALDQPWFRNQGVVQAYLKLLGVKVEWRNVDRIPAGRHIMVSNHCSVGDLMLLFSHPALPRRYTHLVTSSLPARVTQAANLPVLMRPASPAVYEQLAAASETENSVHLFPEGGMTNGRGMLRFSRGFTRIMQQQLNNSNNTRQQQQQEEQQPPSPAHLQPPEDAEQQHQHLQSSYDGSTDSHDSNVRDNYNRSPRTDDSTQSNTPTCLPVVPVALRVRGMPGVRSHTLTSSFLANLFWFSFSSETRLEAAVLPPMRPLPGESRGAFVQRVQAALAAELGVRVYDITIQQKRQLGQKRQKEEAARRR